MNLSIYIRIMAMLIISIYVLLHNQKYEKLFVYPQTDKNVLKMDSVR